jgi:hypothetical protein
VRISESYPQTQRACARSENHSDPI